MNIQRNVDVQTEAGNCLPSGLLLAGDLETDIAKFYLRTSRNDPDKQKLGHRNCPRIHRRPRTAEPRCAVVCSGLHDCRGNDSFVVQRENPIYSASNGIITTGVEHTVHVNKR